MTHTPSIEDPYFNYNSRGEVSQSKRFAGTVANPGAENTAEDFDYGFDPIGNRKTSNVGNSDSPRGYTANILNQYTAITQPTQNPAYDLDGNQTGDGTWTYEWDGENRLVAAEKSGMRLTFTYDYLGRRVEKTVSVWDSEDPQSSPTMAATRSIYDGWNLAAVLSSEETILQSFVWGLDLSSSLQGAGGVGGLLSIWDSSTLSGQPSTHFYCYDGNGNVVALVHAAGGTLSATYEYAPFGERLSASGAMSEANPFQFSTKFYDSETGLYYYGFRYDDPLLGRWLNRDPLNEGAGANLYGVCFGDLLNDVDALGMSPFAEGPPAVYPRPTTIGANTDPDTTEIDPPDSPGPDGDSHGHACGEPEEQRVTRYFCDVRSRSRCLSEDRAQGANPTGEGPS